MSAPKKVCKQCRLEGPWRFDEDGNVTGKCQCREPAATSAEVERDAAITATSEANPNALRAALLIITDTARQHETFSANQCRADMLVAQVPGPVIGAAFGQAVRDGIIRRDGYVPSTQASTHGHPVAQWRSLLWRRAAS